MGLQVDEHALKYSTLLRSWPRSTPRLDVWIDGHPDAFRIPLAYLERCGTNFTHLCKMMQSLVNEPAILHHRLDTGMPGQVVSAAAQPAVGAYVLISQGDAFTWRKGPNGSKKYRAARTPSETSTSSKRSKSTAGNDTFRFEIARRDVFCLVTDSWEQCECAHIVPKARDDIYREIYETSITPNLYSPNMGLLLQVGIHTRFDAFKWSLYHDGEALIVQSFESPDSEVYQKYHGKRIPLTRFNTPILSDRPDQRLLDWHFAQCCMMHIRGFSAQLSINAQ